MVVLGGGGGGNKYKVKVRGGDELFELARTTGRFFSKSPILRKLSF